MARTYPIHKKAPEAPFKCIVSGLPGPVVDLETFVEGYGRVYLSVNVVAAIAATHGFLNDRESEELRGRAAAAEEEAGRWPALMEEFQHGVADLLDAVRARAAGGDPVGDPDDSAGADAAAVEGGVDGAAGAAGAGDGSAVGAERERVPAYADHPFEQPAVPSE